MTSIHEEIQIAIHGIWSRRWIALAIAWAVALLGWLVVSLIPNSYQSSARVYIEAQSILTPRPGTGPMDARQDLDQVRQTLTSVDNLVQVVKGTDLAKSVQTDADVGAKVGMLKKGITIVSQQDNLFDISATAGNPRVAAQIVNKLLDLLAEENFAGNKAATSQAIKVLDTQIAGRAKDLATAERRRVDFEQRNIGMLPGVGSIGQRMDAIRTEMNQVDSQMVAAQSALAGLNGQMGSTPATIDTPGVGGQPGVSPLSQAMGELAAAHARGWTDNHPDVIALKRQIAAIRSAGGATGGGGSSITRTPNPAYMQLRSLQAERSASVTALQVRKAELQAQIAGMAAKQTQEPGIAAEQDRLSRDYDAIKAQYDSLMQDREQARLRGDVQSEAGSFTVKLIDPPGVPSAPTSPNRPMLLVGVLVAALGLGVGAAFALSQLRTTYATAVRLERATGLMVMGSLTETINSAAAAGRKRKLRLFAGASAGLVGMCLLLVVLEFVQRGMAA